MTQSTGATQTTRARQVGVDIQETEENRAVVEAIEADNADWQMTLEQGLRPAAR